jgi:hypothetical protein
MSAAMRLQPTTLCAVSVSNSPLPKTSVSLPAAPRLNKSI